MQKATGPVITMPAEDFERSAAPAQLLVRVLQGITKVSKLLIKYTAALYNITGAQRSAS